MIIIGDSGFFKLFIENTTIEESILLESGYFLYKEDTLSILDFAAIKQQKRYFNYEEFITGKLVE